MMTTAYKAIYRRELKSYFSTPVGYVFIVVFLIGGTYLSFAPGYGDYFQSKQANLNPLFDYVPYLFIFLVPAIAMRLWAEERNTGTAELLFTMPVTVKEAVLAKFFAAWTILAIALSLITASLILTTLYLQYWSFSALDWKPMFTSYTGALLVGAVYLSIGSFCSALSKNQVISFILAVVACLLFFMISSPTVLNTLTIFMPGFVINFLESMSVLNHYEIMQRGVVEFKSVVFFIAMIVSWLLGSGFMLDYQKAR